MTSRKRAPRFSLLFLSICSSEKEGGFDTGSSLQGTSCMNAVRWDMRRSATGLAQASTPGYEERFWKSNVLPTPTLLDLRSKSLILCTNSLHRVKEYHSAPVRLGTTPPDQARTAVRTQPLGIPQDWDRSRRGYRMQTALTASGPRR